MDEHYGCKAEKKLYIKDLDKCESELALSQAREKRLREAVIATHTYFMALTKQWVANDGRVVSESGAVLDGSDEVERLCNIAGEKVGRIMQEEALASDSEKP